MTPLPADAPPRLPGRTRRARRDPRGPAGRPRGRPLDGTLGDAHADAALVEAARACLSPGISRTVEIAGAQLFIEAYPVRPRLVVVGAVEVARTLVRLAKELGYETVVIDGRAAFATEAASPTWTGWWSAGRTRWRTRSASGRPTRSRS